MEYNYIMVMRSGDIYTAYTVAVDKGNGAMAAICWEWDKETAKPVYIEKPLQAVDRIVTIAGFTVYDRIKG